MNSTTGWGEAWGTPGIVLWEMSKMNWSTAREISGRAYPIPTPSRCWRPSQQHLPGTAPGTGRKPHPCASSCPCPAAFQLLLQAPRGAGRRSPAGSQSRPSTQASAGCSLQREKMQLYPAELELFWHVKEWHCCSKYVEKPGIKLGFFFSFWITSTPEPTSCTEMKRSPGKLVEIHLTYSVLLVDQASVWV